MKNTEVKNQISDIPPHGDEDQPGNVIQLATINTAKQTEHIEQGAASRNALNLVDVTDELANPVEPSYLVEGLLEDMTTGAVFGASGSTKSFHVVSLSCSLVTGVPWIGRKVNRTGPVLYLALEGRAGLPRRVRAWQDHHDTKIPKGKLYLHKGLTEFNQAGARVIADVIAQLPEAPVLIVVDTVARALPAGAEENSSKDMTAFVNALDSIRDRFGCVVCLVHHTGHSIEAQGRARGSSSFPAAMDWAILVDRKRNQISWPKMKDAEAPKPVSFELIQVGNSAVIEYGESAEQDHSEDRMTKGEKLGFETLWAACKSRDRKWAELEEWRTEFYRRHTGDSPGAKRGAFLRARNGLVDKQLAFVDKDIYRPSVTALQSVTKRDNATAVTVDSVTERYNTLKGVTHVTHLDSDAPQPETESNEVDYYNEGDLFK